jgi:NH3-dependent NAD+ synthetase
MISENGWFDDNLKDRSHDHTLDYKITINPHKFTPLPFHEAAKQTALKIAWKYDNLYVGLSGGLDSEYVAVCLHQLKIPFKCIIGVCKGNEIESAYAFKICKKLNIEPIVLKYSNIELMKMYMHLVSSINGIGRFALLSLYSAKYVSEQKGTFISGQHILSDDDDSPILYYDANEYDGYGHTLYPNSNEIGFFTYTPELTYSMINGITIENYEVTSDIYKSTLYNLEPRKKTHCTYTPELSNILGDISATRKHYPNIKHLFGNKQETELIFKDYIL